MSGLGTDDWLMIGGGALLLVVMAIWMHMSEDHARMRKRIGQLKQRQNAAPRPKGADTMSLRKSQIRLPPLLQKLMKPLPDMDHLNARLQRAGYRIGARQYLFRCVLAMLVVTFALMMTSLAWWVGPCAGVVLGVLLPIKLLSGKLNKGYKQFLKLFPDAIDLIVRGLRSGLPVSESINLVTSEVPAPVSTIFGHVANTIKLGVPMETALQEMARKLDYTEFNFFVTSIVLQRETGGNLSEILNNLAEVLRKRIMMQLKIKSMTSEARVSAIIVGALPLIVIGAVQVMSPGYLQALYTDPRGERWAMIAAVMLVGGIWTMNRLGKFEI